VKNYENWSTFAEIIVMFLERGSSTLNAEHRPTFATWNVLRVASRLAAYSGLADCWLRLTCRPRHRCTVYV